MHVINIPLLAIVAGYLMHWQFFFAPEQTYGALAVPDHADAKAGVLFVKILGGYQLAAALTCFLTLVFSNRNGKRAVVAAQSLFFFAFSFMFRLEHWQSHGVMNADAVATNHLVFFGFAVGTALLLVIDVAIEFAQRPSTAANKAVKSK